MGYQSNSVLRPRANQLEVQNREAINPERVVEFGTLYVSNDSSTYDTETADLIKKIEQIRHELGDHQPYKYRLDIWHGAKLFECSKIWFGDTSRLYLKNGQLGYYGPKPQPDWIASIHPTNHSEILDFNLKNINSFIEQIGPFEQYKQQYIEHVKEHIDSVLYEQKLTLDLTAAESARSNSDNIGLFGLSTRDWYNSFLDKFDTLNKKDYQILDLNQPLPKLPLFSDSRQRPVPPYLLHLLDNTNDITKAATGYLLHLKIPFLKKLIESYFEKVVAKSLTYEIPGVPFNDLEIAITPASTIESASISVPTETQTGVIQNYFQEL